MHAAMICSALLGLLVFGLGLAVSARRGSSQMIIGHSPDPGDPLHKLIRAHGNAAEYAPMFAVLMLGIAARGCTRWMVWTFIAATACRYLHAAGMILYPRLDQANPLRFVGALGTYITGLMLVVAGLIVA